jgi:hypothetical protein
LIKHGSGGKGVHGSKDRAQSCQGWRVESWGIPIFGLPLAVLVKVKASSRRQFQSSARRSVHTRTHVSLRATFTTHFEHSAQLNRGAYVTHIYHRRPKLVGYFTAVLFLVFCGLFTCVWNRKLYSIEWGNDRWWIGNDFEGSNRRLIEMVSGNLPE